MEYISAETAKEINAALLEASKKKGVTIPMGPEAAKERFDKWYRAYTEQYVSYLVQSNENNDFTEGAQFTADELTAIADRKQYAFSINRIQKFIRTLVGMFTASNPTFVAKPFGAEDHNIADICNNIFTYVMNRSQGGAVLRRALRSGVGKNIGYGMVKRNDINEVVIDYVPMDFIAVDPDSKHPYFEDAPTIWYHAFVDKKTVQRLYGVETKDLDTVVPDDLAQLYTAASEKLPSITYDKNKDYIRIIEGWHRIVEKEFEKFPDGRMEFTGRISRKIIKETIVGYKHVYIEQLPDAITRHCIKPVYYHDNDTIYKKSMTHFLKETQRFLNKSFGIMTYNAQLSSNNIIFIHKDSISDEDQVNFEDKVAMPGAVIYLQSVDGERVMPTFKTAGTIQGAWYEIIMLLLREFDVQAFNSQYFDMDTSKENRSSALLGSYEMMLNSVRELMSIYEGFIASLGISVLEYFFEYTPPEKIRKICGVDECIKHLEELKQYYQLDMTSIESIKAFQQTAAQQKMESTRIEDLINVGREKLNYMQTLDKMITERNFIDFDISVEKGSYLPSHSVYRFMLKLELYRSNLIDNETLLEDIPLKNKEKLIARTSMLRKLQSQVTNMAEMNEDLQLENNNLKKDIFKEKEATLLAVHEGKLGKDYTDKRVKGSKDLKINNLTGRFKMDNDRKEAQHIYDLKIKELDLLIGQWKDKLNEAKSESSEPEWTFKDIIKGG